MSSLRSSAIPFGVYPQAGRADETQRESNGRRRAGCSRLRHQRRNYRQLVFYGLAADARLPWLKVGPER